MQVCTHNNNSYLYNQKKYWYILLRLKLITNTFITSRIKSKILQIISVYHRNEKL